MTRHRYFNLIHLGALAYLDGEDDENVVILREPHVVQKIWYGVPTPFLNADVEQWLEEAGVSYRLGSIFDPTGWDPVKLVGDLQRPAIAFDTVADATWFRMRW